jgi:anti-sigma factor RsiW
MSTDWSDQELEALVAGLADTDEARAQLLEEHRQLEKDLLRLADPPPPGDFVAAVMRKVQQAPARPVSRREAVMAGLVVLTAVVSALGALVLGGGVAGVGLAVADLAIEVRDGLVAMGSGLFALWTTAAVPLAIALSLTIGLMLLALRRFAQPAAKVTS